MSRSDLKVNIIKLLTDLKDKNDKSGRFNSSKTILQTCCRDILEDAEIRSYPQFENELNTGMINDTFLRKINERLQRILGERQQPRGGKRSTKKKSKKTKKSKISGYKNKKKKSTRKIKKKQKKTRKKKAGDPTKPKPIIKSITASLSCPKWKPFRGPDNKCTPCSQPPDVKQVLPYELYVNKKCPQNFPVKENGPILQMNKRCGDCFDFDQSTFNKSKEEWKYEDFTNIEDSRGFCLRKPQMGSLYWRGRSGGEDRMSKLASDVFDPVIQMEKNDIYFAPYEVARRYGGKIDQRMMLSRVVSDDVELFDLDSLYNLFLLSNMFLQDKEATIRSVDEVKANVIANKQFTKYTDWEFPDKTGDELIIKQETIDSAFSKVKQIIESRPDNLFPTNDKVRTVGSLIEEKIGEPQIITGFNVCITPIMGIQTDAPIQHFIEFRNNRWIIDNYLKGFFTLEEIYIVITSFYATSPFVFLPYPVTFDQFKDILEHTVNIKDHVKRLSYYDEDKDLQLFLNALNFDGLLYLGENKDFIYRTLYDYDNPPNAKQISFKENKRTKKKTGYHHQELAIFPKAIPKVEVVMSYFMQSDPNMAEEINVTDKYKDMSKEKLISLLMYDNKLNVDSVDEEKGNPQYRKLELVKKYGSEIPGNPLYWLQGKTREELLEFAKETDPDVLNERGIAF